MRKNGHFMEFPNSTKRRALLLAWLLAVLLAPLLAQPAQPLVTRADESRFVVLRPTRMAAAKGSLLTLEGDGTIRVRDAGGGRTIAATESLTFECLVDRNGLTGLRIETLADPDGPAGGPGLADNGNFVLTEFTVEQAPKNSDGFKPVLLERPSTDHEQQGFGVAAAIDGAPATGWAISPQFGVAHEAVFEAQRDLGFEAGVKLRLRLDFAFGGRHVASRLRLSCTDAKRPLQARRDLTALNEAQGRVGLAIGRGVRWLLEQQELDGLWASRAEDVKHGMTGLAGYTLLKCGVGRDHPAVQRAAARLQCEPTSHVYAAGFELMFLAELQDDALLGRIEETARRLLSWQQGGGGFSYPAASAADLSNMQYAALGLRAAAKRGVKIPPEAWMKLGDATLAHQEKVDSAYEGAGFGYYPGGAAYGSVTTGGVCVLKIVDEQLAKSGASKAAYATGWRRGVAWLDRNFAADTNPRNGTWLWYWLYGVERVGGLCEVDELAGKSWYREGARVAVEAQQADGKWDGDGGPQPSTCFALLFLARATSAVSGVTVRGENLWGGDDPQFDVSLRGSGDTPLTLWVSSFGGAAKAFEWPGEAGQGPRVIDVTYAVPGRALLADSRDGPTAWRMSETAPLGPFADPAFDDKGWKSVSGALGDPATSGIAVRTPTSAAELWLRREFTLDDAPRLDPQLYVAAPAPPEAVPTAPLLCLFDEEPEFAAQLTESSGGGSVTTRDGNAANGRAWLAVQPQQVHHPALPGWRFPIAAEPRPGEFRYLRWSWRKEGGGAVMVQLAANGAWGASTVRRHAGSSEVDWPSTALADSAPKEWRTETIDLVAAFGGATTLTGLALTPISGGLGGYDAIYLARSLSDFDAIPRSTSAHAAVARPRAASPPPGSDAVAELELFLNGTRLFHGRDALAPYTPVPTEVPLAPLLRTGRNVLAIHLRRGATFSGVDVALLDQRVLAVVAGAADRPAGPERFATQFTFDRNGSYPIRALVRLAAPPEKGPPAEALFSSPLVTVPIRRAPDPELLRYAGDAGRNLLGPGNAVATASSQFSGDFAPALAVDNLASRGWLCADGDQRPTLTLELKKPMRADTLLITPIQQRLFEIDRQGWRVRRLEVALDRGKGGTFEVVLPRDGRKGEVRLPRVQVVRRIDVRVVDCSDRPAAKSAVGIAEVELQLRK